MPGTINLNQVLRGPGDDSDIESQGTLKFVVGSGIQLNFAGVDGAGSTSSDATVTDADIIVIQTGSANTGVRFRTFPGGRMKLVFNQSSTAKKVYPPTGGTLNAWLPDTAHILNSGVGALFMSLSSTGAVVTLVS